MRTGKEETLLLYDLTMCFPRMLRVAASVCLKATPTLLKTWSISDMIERRKNGVLNEHKIGKRWRRGACLAAACGRFLNSRYGVWNDHNNLRTWWFETLQSRKRPGYKMVSSRVTLRKQYSPSCVCPFKPKCTSMTSNTPTDTSKWRYPMKNLLKERRTWVFHGCLRKSRREMFMY